MKILTTKVILVFFIMEIHFEHPQTTKTEEKNSSVNLRFTHTPP